MPMYDFHCLTCAKDFEEFSYFSKEMGRVAPVDHFCGTLSEMVMRKAPALRSDEKLPADLRRTAIAHWGRDFESRSEHDRFCAERGVTPEYVPDIDVVAKHTRAYADEDEVDLTQEEKAESNATAAEDWDRMEQGALEVPQTADTELLKEAAGVISDADAD